MPKKFVIFFLLYLFGIFLSPALASIEFELEKNLVHSFVEESGQGEINIEVNRKANPEKDYDQSFSLAFFKDFPGNFHPSFCGIHKLAASISFKGSKPLYLLFHSLLFYELI